MMTENALCTENPSPVFNLTKPGDYCEKVSECFGLETEISCTKNKCVTERVGSCPGSETSATAGHKWCSTGNYCDSETNQCTITKSANEECAHGYQCKFGLDCIGLIRVIGKSNMFQIINLYSLWK
jgi:hypothetical protein